MACDTCGQLLVRGGKPVIDSQAELEWHANKLKWEPDPEHSPTKWYCPTCQVAMNRKSLLEK
jgi:hypothetical protein